MSISINCKLSLSKKLRALLGKEASLTLVSQDIVEGKGTAILILNSDDIKADINPEEMGETSIMLVPVEIAEESPSSNSPVHASIFSTIPQKHQEETLVQKMAAVHAPEKGQEARAIKNEAKVPEAFAELKNKDCSSWIKNMDELANAINVAKSKRSEVDPEYAQNAREKAILQELKEKSEAIDIPAWIVNDKVGILSINDLNIALPLNSPYDLSNISAKRIAASKDLRGLLREGYIRFISPLERDEFVLKTIDGETEAVSGLSVFDNHEQAMDNIGGSVVSSRNPIINDESAMDITDEDVVHKTEDESMILNLTQNMPTIKNRQPVPEGNRKTVHTNATPTSTSKNPNIKPIRKLS